MRQFDLVYWNTAVSAGAPVGAGRYRARVLNGARQVGTLDIQVAANAADAAKVDRERYAAVVRGHQLTLRFRVGRSTMAAASVSADTVRMIADQLYATLDANIDVTDGVHDVMAMLMPLIDASKQAEGEARLAQGLPTAFDFQSGLVARAFNARTRTSVASFVAAAADQGAAMQGGGALTVDALGTVLRSAAGQTRYAPEEIVPALVVALGQARATRAGVTPDATWGDGQLDPLQTTLLMYALHYSGLDASTPPNGVASTIATTSLRPNASVTPNGPRYGIGVSPIGGAGVWIATKVVGFAGNSLRGWVTGRIGTAIEMPLTWGQAATASVCASVLLNSYRFAVTASPTQLGHNGIGLPTTSAINADLTFDFVPSAFGAQVLAKAKCTLPTNGAAPGKSVQWTVGAGLRPHGTLTQQAGTTDASGRAQATYMTVTEVVPVAMRTLAKDATGTIDVRATGLVPGWSRLERSVGVGVANPTDTGVRLQVRYYEWPSAIKVEYSIGLSTPLLSQTLIHYTTVAGDFTMPRSEHDDIVEYFGEGRYAYTDYHMTGVFGNGCNVVPTTTVSGKVGFELLARDPINGSTLRATPYPALPIGSERFNIVCNPGGTFPDEMGGFGTMLAFAYMPIDPGAAHARSANMFADWQVVEPGVLRRTVERAIAGPRGPLNERSVYTLRLQP